MAENREGERGGEAKGDADAVRVGDWLEGGAGGACARGVRGVRASMELADKRLKANTLEFSDGLGLDLADAFAFIFLFLSLCALFVQPRAVPI